MRDEFDNEVTTDEILEGFEADLEAAFWPTLHDDPLLSDDDRAEVTRLVEEAEENIRAARKITSASSDE